MSAPGARPVLLASLLVCAATLLLRLPHLKLLWVDEAYGMAAAERLLAGATLYRDVWFDKPPLYAWVYLLWGAEAGWPLRIAGALFAAVSSLLAGLAALRLFGPREATAAALLLGFFLTFDHPVVTLSLAPDLLSVPFALAAVWAAASGRSTLAGALAGAALHANSKALLLLPLVILWRPAGLWRALAGWAAAFTAGLAVLAAQGALGGYFNQVWEWGMLYSRDSPLAHPLAEGLRRTANWVGFHAALTLGAAVFWWRQRDRTALLLAVWAVLGLAAIVLGWRFFPRYYFALLPALTLAAARGLTLVPRRARVPFLVLLLCVPTVRFGARTALLAQEALAGETPRWSDLAMLRDCEDAARDLRRLARPGETLLVWGYRPELNVLAAMPAATRFLDSQPLTGVLADRHLVSSKPTAAALAAEHRRELVQTSPDFIADGLGPYNPALAITAYPELAGWLSGYRLAASTRGTRIYSRAPGGQAPPP